jgi:hypothetical protein
MKTLSNCLFLAVLVAFAGCATHSTTVVNQPVGPDLAPPRVNLSQGQGRLMVYTVTEVNDPASSDFPTHSSYAIYTTDGKLVRRVDNRSGSFYQNPVTVSLALGTYKVKGRATNSGEVTVPVIIEEKKTTVVDLEGTNLPQHKPTGAGQWVRLSTGQVIGMRVE